MKKTLLFASLSSLLITSFVSAQTTFDFTAGSLSGSGHLQTWSQTVNGITCTAEFNRDTRKSSGYLAANSPALTTPDEGLYCGALHFVTADRLSKQELGFRLTFSEDVRLVGYRIGTGSDFINDHISLAGGNVSAIMARLTEDIDHPFEVEALVPANTPIDSFISRSGAGYRLLPPHGGARNLCRTSCSPAPEGNETGITRMHVHSTSRK